MAFPRIQVFVVLVLLSYMANAGDPDILTDYVAPPNVTVDGNFFTYTGFRPFTTNPDPPTTFRATKASISEFPALDGQSVSYAFLQFPAGVVNPPHTHPRGTELLLLLYGTLEVGFVDTTNKLFAQTLQAGDMFIFPKGLAHYQYNSNSTGIALALSAFGSANAGTVSVPLSLFTTGIDDGILAKSFKTDLATIQRLKAGIQPNPGMEVGY